MILPSGFVEFSIINAHMPTSDSPLRNEFIALILDNHHTTLLWHHLYCTHPLTIRNRVNNCSLKQFKHLLIYYLPHHIIKFALMLPDRLMVLFHGNVMGAKDRTNPFEICKGIAND
jgi:hypothetical protein